MVRRCVYSHFLCDLSDDPVFRRHSLLHQTRKWTCRSPPSSPFFLHLLNLFKTGEILLCVGETKAFVHAVCNAVITVSEDLLLLSRNDRDKFALHRLPSRTMENRESFVLVIRNQLLSRRFLVFNMTLRILFSSRSRRRSRWFLTVESKGTFVKRRNEYISIS